MPSKNSVTDRLAVVANKRVKELEGLVEKQAGQIERLRRAKFSIPAGRKKSTGKSYVRVVIPDSHGAHIDTPAAAAFLKDLAILQPAEIVWLGDHLDCGGFLAQHHTLGFVPESAYSFEDDTVAANTFIDAVQTRAPRAESYYIMGNHEARIEKWILKETLRHPRDSAYLNRHFGPAAVLSLAKRGITAVNRDEQYHGLQKRGTIKLGKCHFHHGTRCGVNAARANLQDFAANVQFGHTHRIAACVQETVGGIIGAWSNGCLCQLHPLYYDTNPTNWCHGYGLDIVARDGTFTHFTIPILDGVSYLRMLAAS